MYNRTLYTFWFGPEMSKDRKYCFDSMVANSGVNLVLVTENNLQDFVTRPLHKGFNYLSATHKSAYLRPYFMKHHGEGYTDIKYLDHSFAPYYDMLDNSDCDFIGYQEQVFGSWSKDHPNKEKLLGCGRYIFKKNTRFANIWYNKLCKYLDAVFDQLKQNPGTYHPRAVPGRIGGGGRETTSINYNKYGNYPLPWGIPGQIFQEVMLDNTDSYMSGMKWTFKTDPNWVPYR